MSGPGPDDSSSASGPRDESDDGEGSDGDHDERSRDRSHRSRPDSGDGVGSDGDGNDGSGNDGRANGPADESRTNGDGPGRRSDGTGPDGYGTGADPERHDADSDRFDRRPARTDEVTIEDDGVVRWFLNSSDSTVTVVRDVASSVAIVLLIGLLLFAVSGVWPPLVAVESGSMEPGMERGDMIVVVDEHRFVGDEPIDGTGIVTAADGQSGGHEKFGQHGDVIIFEPDGEEFRTPVIHRAHYWVEEGDNWVDEQADPANLNGATCADLTTCPADHDGFITKGDANDGYDQAGSGAPTDVVKPEWINGKASVRIPWLGHVRLLFDSLLVKSPSHSPTGSVLPGGSSGLQAGLVAVASAVAIAGSRRPGSW